MVLQASGPDAAALLTANLPSVGADGASPADSLQQWQRVAARVALTPQQRLMLADWRARYLQQLDDCYGRRVLQKAQVGPWLRHWHTLPCLRWTIIACRAGAVVRGECIAGRPAGCSSVLLQLGAPLTRPLFHCCCCRCPPFPVAAVQITQLPGGSDGGQQSQWVEALLLQAAQRSGFSGKPAAISAAACCWAALGSHGSTQCPGGCSAVPLATQAPTAACPQTHQAPALPCPAPATIAAGAACALACVQLDGVVSALGESVREERSKASAMMAELLGRILTQVQAARFLLAGHPFCWNGLSFASAVAAMPLPLPGPQPLPQPPLQPPKQEALSELLRRHG